MITAEYNLQDYMDEYEEHRGKGSFPAMITPAYLNAKKANELASDVSMNLDVSANMGQIQNACYSLSGVILFEQLMKAYKKNKSLEDISCFFVVYQIDPLFEF